MTRIRTFADASASEDIIPHATYAPWKPGRASLDLFEAIRQDTRLDIHHGWIVWQLVEQVSKLQGCLIEAGVWRGGSGTLIASPARQPGIPDFICLCDAFRGIVKAAPDDLVYRNGVLATPRVSVDRFAEHFQLDRVRVVEGVFPDEAGAQAREKQVRFCHIDVDAYRSARDIFDWVWNRMVVGMGLYRRPGVTRGTC